MAPRGIATLRRAKPVLEQLGGGRRTGAGTGQRGERLPQVAEREYATRSAQPTARTAVIADGDHRRDVERHLVLQRDERRQRGVQPVAAAERHYADRAVS